MARRLFHVLLATATLLGAATAYAMSPEELAMTRNVAERGNAAAQMLLAIAYLDGDGGLARDEKLACHWFEQAALQGNGYAEARLGDLYEEGIGVERNPKLAADWRERAARRGNIDAQLKLGRMYLQGIGVTQDLARAREWLQQAAEGGDSEAAYLLSQLYKHGLGGPRDPTVAGNWLARSAERGYLESIRLLHAIKSFGRHYDRTLSGDALKQLAADGDADAQYQLGLHYEAGSGGERRDAAQAAEWFQRAANQGNEQARHALTILKPGSEAANINR
jgi:uncharacterized protein